MKTGYVYAGRVAEAGLKSMIAKLSSRVVLSWDLARLEFSEELRNTGRAFDSGMEIRWQREGDVFWVLVLSDAEKPELGLEPVEGKWTAADEDTVQLVDLQDRRFSPQFAEYPVVRAAKARLKCKTFLRNKVPMFITPREVVSDESS